MKTSNTSPAPTVFDRALEAYLANLPEDKKKFKFVDLCRGSGQVTAQDINDLIETEVSKRTLSGPAKRTFNRLINAVKDFSGVIDQIASVQPLPLAIIWGGLKCVVEGAARSKDMFDLMKDEIRALTDLIENIVDYEELYGECQVMQDLFFLSYTNIISFWHRIHKECKATEIGAFRRSMTSTNLNKLKSIVSDLKSNAASISQKASVLQANLDAKEYSEAQRERVKANAERAAQSDWRHKQNAINYTDLCAQILDFLAPKEACYLRSASRHDKNLELLQAGTCGWLADDPTYTSWLDPTQMETPIFCVSGPAGFGKSFLSSFAIRQLRDKHNAAVAYFFCQFSEPCEDTYNVLKLFAFQLFNIYFARELPVDDGLCRKVLCCNSTSLLQELIGELSINLHPVYFVVDGLDEAQKGTSQQTMSSVLGFICDKMLGNSKLWITIRKQVRPVECYESVVRRRPHINFEMVDHTEADVVRYLDAKFGTLEQRLGSLNEDEQIIFHFSKSYLKTRARGHFLWARLMTQDFTHVEDVHDLFKRISGPPPDQLDKLYRDIFDRIRPENRKIASKIIGLIAFSRRQLRMEEVRDAAVLLVTRGRRNAGDGGLAGAKINVLLSKYTVLVEIDKDEQDSEGSCRLVHSSVLEFLLNHPNVLGNELPLQITPYTIADACLTYLARPIYGSLLQTRSLGSDAFEWIDSSDRSIMDEHHFVQYAAKYWSRHLEDVEPEKFRARVAKFVESNNFQTCMQIQTIWIQGKFDTYTVGGQKSILRVLPDWFICSPTIRGKRSEVSKHWTHYRILFHNWQHLLSCGGCHDNEPECPLLLYRGNLDRIWWASLGADNVFSGFSSRYVSFSLIESTTKLILERRDPSLFEALCVTGEHLVVLWLRSWNHQVGTLEFICQRWTTASPGSPTVQMTQIIRTNDASTKWRFYTKRTKEVSRKLVAKPLLFSTTGEYFRIGTQLFVWDGEHEYRPMTYDADDEGPPLYFEELSGRAAFIAVGSRAYSIAKEPQRPSRVEENFGADFIRLEQFGKQETKRRDSNNVSEDEQECESSELSDDSSDAVDEAEGYESWSEGSTDNEGESSLGESDSEDAMSNSVADSEPEPGDDSADSEESLSDLANEVSSSDSGDDSSGPEPDTPANDQADPASEDSNSDSEDTEPEFIRWNADVENSDDEDDFWGHVIDARLGAFQHGRSRFKRWETSENGPEDEMLLVVIDNSGSHPKKLFQFSHPLSLMLYNSPPAIHPHASLVVWPLGAGDVLFADFASKTYFMRKVKASAPYSRGISMKLHFHSSGKFLHIASVEAQLGGQGKPSSHKHRQEFQMPPPLELSVLLSTYRLSSTKTTRSPPSLIHRVKVDLGKHVTLTPTHLPFTFTWTDEELFVSRSARELTVARVPLFVKSAQGHSILAPRNKTLLPDTAESCDVYFVPSVGEAPARVILSSEFSGPQIPSLHDNMDPIAQLLNFALGGGGNKRSRGSTRKMLSPPVGCLLQEEDIGGWVKLDEVPVPKRQGAGKLDRRKERFDPVDDCDVEPYLRFV